MTNHDSPDWSQIDTVCLDMDGTVLDLRFDNFFWLEEVPRHYAERHGLEAGTALAELQPRLDAVRGTLDWYCVDYWSRQLALDVVALKRAYRASHSLPAGCDPVSRLRARAGASACC